MNKQLIFFAILLMTSTLAFGQGDAEEKEPEKSTKNAVTVFSIFDTRIEISKNKEGRRTFEFYSSPKVYEDEELERYIKKANTHSTDLQFDLGINQWIGSADAPEVRAWGSWNPAINFDYTYRPGKNFRLKSMIGVSWYNFKFEDRNIQALRGEDGIVFEDYSPGGGTKSKISASYLSAGLIPTFTTGNGKIRIGAGPYVGTRLGGRGKFVYNNDEGKRTKEFQRTNLFVNNFRYGARLEVGVANVDLFMNYDLNEMFQTDKGPQVNTISFGIIL
ncbi:hypothetical protein A33Q_1927 [Indibacter alkaliphilus LW1]|jgi:hypothetical protein|uniref:Outer membrane protein beta-barrel domain-containing protein n=1 Tax=Indibacter alkaliphilus (strain CCUG 57479 / KCTC 22604 / LW1) TaxID=1189612 RepID=S2DDN0_INDAL|nr:hypothetical protein [Indibacter alkaliphilus]EOZ97009.1 hypothetical protein A33Q_1927 [Indibacter alkaliphilus LW1]